MLPPVLIVGPTASGKTTLSLFLASEVPNFFETKGIDILVVDSKQVFRGQDIVTGKDMPKGFKVQGSGSRQSFLTDGRIRLFGLDLVNPNQSWSVAQFLSYAQTVKDQSEKDDHFLIIVGGTPLYTLSLFQGPETAVVTPNLDLREELSSASVRELQDRLKKISPKRFRFLNESDQKNPRRLIRAIEIEIAKRLRGGWLPAHQGVNTPLHAILSKDDVCFVGITLSKEEIEARIRIRVKERLQAGALEEYEKLASDPLWSKEAKSALGYSELEQFVSGTISNEELETLWTLHETQYAKRQMTWWKREHQIQWFDRASSDLQSQVLEYVKNWYNGFR